MDIIQMVTIPTTQIKAVRGEKVENVLISLLWEVSQLL